MTSITTSPTVSVIIPAYNQAQYLPDALDSLLAQTYTNWEAVIVDDGSPDNVAEIAARYTGCDPRIKFLHTENHGLSAARNTGAAHSAGEYLVFLDGDDKIAPEYIEDCVKALQSDSRIKVAAPQMQCFGIHQQIWPVVYEDYAQILINNPLYATAAMRRADFDAIGGYDERMRKGFEDWEFWIRLLAGKGPDAVWTGPDILFFYRQKQQSMIVDSMRGATLADNRAYIFNKHHEKYDTEFGDIVRPNLLAAADYPMVAPLLRRGDEPTPLKEIVRQAKRISRSPQLSTDAKMHLLSLYSGLCMSRKPCKTDNLNAKQLLRFYLLKKNPEAFDRLNNICRR